MSEPVLASASAEGFARVEEICPQGMIAFRGDLEASEVRRALEEVTGLKIPKQRGILLDGERGLGWMSPDEVLILLPYADVPSALSTLQDRLSGAHHLAVDVSDARAVFRISGKRAREVLAKLAPVDLSPGCLGPGELRRTRVAQVAAAFWIDETGAITLICFRSVARYVSDLLMLSANQGTEIGLYEA